jgi:creatinine amidohydrolase
LRRLAQLTWPEAQVAIRSGALALWPIGSTEAHGPHLPLDTDVAIAHETCRRAAPLIREKFGVEALMLHPLGFTVTDFAAPFSGTITIPKDTALAYVRDSIVGAAALGFRAVCLVNAHLEPAHRFMLRDAVKAAKATAACPLALFDPADRRFAPWLGDEFQKSAHAGRYETSLMLAADAARVQTQKQSALPSLDVDLVGAMKGGARNFLEVGAKDAYLGDPQSATAAEGDALYALLASMVLGVIGDALAENQGELT